MEISKTIMDGLIVLISEIHIIVFNPRYIK